MITGSSTIGQAVSLELAQQVRCLLASTRTSAGSNTACGQLTLPAIMQGWRVFSGVRSEADADRLRQLHADINPVIINVTS